jgi:diaminopropionate ammonia-lyase
MTVSRQRAELALNEAVDFIGPVACVDPRAFHARLPGYAPSPLRSAPKVARMLGVRTAWIKDETDRLGLPSFKVLGASYATYRALEQRAGRPLGCWRTVDELRELVSRAVGRVTLAAATDGNHGRAVARMARLLGLEARVFVPAGTATARIAAIESEGASVAVVDGTYAAAVARSAREAGPECLVISDMAWPGYEDVPRWVIDGYGTIFAELDDQLDEVPDVVAVQIGVGALACAAARHLRRAGAPRVPRMLAVEPLGAACILASMRAGREVSVPGPHDSIMAGLNCDAPSPVAWPVVSRAYDVCVAVDDDAAREAMRALAADGIVAGETGAAGLAGLLACRHDPALVDAARALGLDEMASVLMLVTEGATDPDAYDSILDSRGA